MFILKAKSFFDFVFLTERVKAMENEEMRNIQKGVYIPRWVLEDRDLTVDDKWKMIVALAKKQGGLQHD